MREVREWTVDYGDGTKEISLPHVWSTDVDVRWEGPATYKTFIDLDAPNTLRFEGVSYAAEVSVNGHVPVIHHGIWDAFEIPLSAGPNEVVVRITKNGAATYPVKDVLSGFLPYVFHTFGGIWRSVWLTDGEILVRPVAEARISLRENRLFWDGSPVYLRGALHWGWYPETGNPNSPDMIAREVELARQMGFNLMKFCLWVPPHQFLTALREAGMMAWIELPLWAPAEGFDEAAALAEVVRITEQYRHHDNVVAWTAGCELGSTVRPEFRAELVRRIQEITGCPLVKDNSGGSEMYGADLREFGTFADFHPYADLPFYPPVLDSLRTGARARQPILLGEFNDHDVHRDTERLQAEKPFWASGDPALNDVGVRWQYDLPTFLPVTHFEADRHARLMESSRQKALFIRRFTHDFVRQHADMAGYVVTGWRDTPISSSGMVDDWLEPRFSAEECAAWNSDAAFFLIPNRRPPWVNGGNRAGWQSLYAGFSGANTVRIGASLPVGEHSVDVALAGGTGFAREISVMETDAFSPQFLAELSWDANPGHTSIQVRLDGRVVRQWPILIREKTAYEPGTVPPTVPMPFWRECIQEFHDDPLWARLGYRDQWEFWVDVSPDGAMVPAWLNSGHQGWKPVMTRIDMRTYARHVYVARTDAGYVHCLRLEGGHGIQPYGYASNPVANGLAAALRD